jgi:hypothetical protein
MTGIVTGVVTGIIIEPSPQPPATGYCVKILEYPLVFHSLLQRGIENFSLKA